MNGKLAFVALATFLFGIHAAGIAGAKSAGGPAPASVPKESDDKDSDDDDDTQSKDPVKKVHGKWSWYDHGKSGCTETVYVFSGKKEDIYFYPEKNDTAEKPGNSSAGHSSANDSSESKTGKPSHKVVNIDYHAKDGILFMVNAAGAKRWLAAYRFADDDMLTRQTIYLDDGHQYVPFADPAPKWNNVSVQEGEEQMTRCGEEAQAIVDAYENSDDSSANASKSAASGVSVPSAAPFQGMGRGGRHR